MDNEVSTSLSLTIQLMIVAVVVGILALFMVFSQNFGRSAVSEVAQTQSGLYATELRALGDYETIPAAALLAILRKSEDAVKSVQGSAYGVTISKTEDLADIGLLSQKVRIRLEPTDDGLYEVQIIAEGEKFPDE
jgi:hypothetical protein